MRIPWWRGTAMIMAGNLMLGFACVAGAAPATAESLAGPSTAQLRAALLTAANLPVGMLFQSEPLPSGASVDKFGPCQFAATGSQPRENADVGFTNDADAFDVVTLVEALQQYPVGAAVEQLQQFAAVVSHCHSMSFKDGPLEVLLTVEREAFPSYGNGTVALRMVANIVSRGNLAVFSDIVAVRHGGTVMVITNSATQLVFDPGLTRIAVAAAYKKVAALP